jgi:hypothetical protein
MLLLLYYYVRVPHIKISGAASIGDVTAKISRKLKLPRWECVTITITDGRSFSIENGGKYHMEQTYDEEADTRLKLRTRYDMPDRTYMVEEIRFDAAGDLNRLFEDLKQELGFELPRPTQCSFTPAPWTCGQDILITTQETKLYDTATKEALKRRSFVIELEDGNWQSGEVLSPWRASRDHVWAQLRLLRSLPDLSHFRVVRGRLDISGIQVGPSGAIKMVASLYRVCFRVEQISGEFKEYICQNITPGHAVETVWEHL